MSVIVIEGPIGAGKTSLIKRLENEWNDNNNVSYWMEQSFTSVKIGKNDFNLLEANYNKNIKMDAIICAQLLINEVLSEYYNKSVKNAKRLVLMDRWIPSCKHFTEVYHKMGMLTPMSYEYIKRQTDRAQKKFIGKLKGKKIYPMYLDTPIEECVSRVKKRGRPEEKLLSAKQLRKRLTFFRTAAMTNQKYYKIGNEEELINEIKKIKELTV